MIRAIGAVLLLQAAVALGCDDEEDGTPSKTGSCESFSAHLAQAGVLEGCSEKLSEEQYREYCEADYGPDNAEGACSKERAAVLACLEALPTECDPWAKPVGDEGCTAAKDGFYACSTSSRREPSVDEFCEGLCVMVKEENCGERCIEHCPECVSEWKTESDLWMCAQSAATASCKEYGVTDKRALLSVVGAGCGIDCDVGAMWDEQSPVDCNAACSGKDCGESSGCDCGTCDADETCSNNKCYAPTPSGCAEVCADRVCGTVGECTCGTCSVGSICNEDGDCVPER
jgi:hypothetical protein